MVHIDSTLQTTKLGEQLRHFARLNAYSRVFDVHNESLRSYIVPDSDLNLASHRKFQRILNQVEKNLFEATTVSY